MARIPVPQIFQALSHQQLTAAQKSELRGLVQIAANASDATQNRIAMICPPGSILEVTAEIFRRTTDIPLELPVCMVMAFVAALLVARGAGIRIGGKHVDPFLWMILLAQSGAGKTYVEQFISRHVSVPMFPQSSSAVKFVEELAQNNHSLWLQDEFAQFLKRIQRHEYMADVREHMLRVYDKSEIVHNTKKGKIIIPDPVLTILGMTVSDTFSDNISSEMMLDGFMQRFQLIFADADPERPMSDFAFYTAHEPRWSNTFARAWRKIAAVKLHGTYALGAGAVDEYKQRFRQLVAHMGEVPGSFVRRIAWNANKLALVYHVILCKSTRIIEREAMRWAMNMTALHLEDLRRLVDSYGVSELARLIKRGEGIRDRFHENHGRKITRREFPMYLKNVNNHGLMNFVMSVLGIE